MLEQTETPHEISEAESTKSAGFEQLETFRSIEAKVKVFAFGEGFDARAVSLETQKRIAEWQEKKHAAMEKLRERLRAVDAGEAIQNGTHAKTVHQNPDGLLYLIEKNGAEKKEISLTRGELLTDILWESEYRLQKDVLPEVRKEFAFALAEKEISSLLDRQIALWESEQKYNVGGGLDKAYRKVLAAAESGRILEGNIAEKMVESFLIKLAIDYDLPFTIEVADVKLDVDGKIDFIVHAKHSVGARVRSLKEDIGIQFTLKKNEEDLERKKQQIRQSKFSLNSLNSSDRKEKEITEIVLVTIPLSDSKALYEKWKSGNPPAPGGPDKLWDDGTKRLIFGGFSGKFFRKPSSAQWKIKFFAKTPSPAPLK